MKYIIYLISFFPIICTAQKWNVGLMTSPDITYNTTNDNETHPLGFEIGFTAYRKLSNSFYFNTGLTIAKRKANDTYHNSYYGDPSVIVYTYLNSTDLNIPLLLNYQLPVSKKFSITSSAGIILGWTLSGKNRTKMVSPDEVIYNGTNKIDNRNNWKEPDKLYFSYGLGGLYKINDKFSVILMPNAMISIIHGGYDISYNLRASLLYNL